MHCQAKQVTCDNINLQYFSPFLGYNSVTVEFHHIQHWRVVPIGGKEAVELLVNSTDPGGRRSKVAQKCRWAPYLLAPA